MGIVPGYHGQVAEGLAQRSPLIGDGFACRRKPGTTFNRFHKGFSLMEIIAVLALITMVTGVIVGSYVNIVMSLEEKPIERIFRETVREARIQAATTKNIVYLSYDKGLSEFVLTERSQGVQAEEGEALEPLNETEVDGDDYEVLFYPKMAKRSGFGSSNNEFAEKDIKYLVFHPSGTSTSAKILFRYDNEETHLTLDSFSSGSIPTKQQL